MGASPVPSSVANGDANGDATASALPSSDERARAQLARAQCPANERIAWFEGGKLREQLCPSEVEAHSLTVVDLSDEWVPHAFDDEPASPAGPLEFRREFASLAGERFDQLPADDRSRNERYLELYGITPTFSVLRERLREGARHRCHDAVEPGPLQALDAPVDAWRQVAEQESDRALAVRWGKELDRVRRLRKAESIASLASDARLSAMVRAWRALRTRLDAVKAAQEHLRCEDAAFTFSPGVVDDSTRAALARYFKKHARIAWTLDPEVATTLAAPSRALEWHAFLRALRERVVDATGLVEDGTALDAPGLVVGQRLDSHVVTSVLGQTALADGAPDAISEATDAAARALGWLGPNELVTFFAGNPGPLGRVALALPPRPRYHAAHMELRASIDRGEVRYDYPFNGAGERKVATPRRRPALVVYAKDGELWRPLFRWGTTIGDWKPERVGKRVLLAYKESPSGPRVWRDLVLAPRWLPPESTPARDLVMPTRDGYRLRTDLLGPSYASAYGLAMLVHHLPAGREFVDQGIRTHGSVSYDSIHQGASHGCHRLHNHRMLRLAAFLLRHREHTTHGNEPFAVRRTFLLGKEKIVAGIDSRGYRHELTPPVPVEVLQGSVVGKDKRARAAPVELPPNMAERFRSDWHD